MILFRLLLLATIVPLVLGEDPLRSIEGSCLLSLLGLLLVVVWRLPLPLLVLLRETRRRLPEDVEPASEIIKLSTTRTRDVALLCVTGGYEISAEQTAAGERGGATSAAMLKARKTQHGTHDR